ncbi:hypothetical protein K491DRAFT_695615 [Lophiostoma macrostomum CBS 122681]|uniref:Uncharacterized protein n=1 Tax=Lophiostoma macrostomum CBS 122681 TaxID=1314788 RepID=A0A6A6T0H1_9PLEO|nr:hypothetical protein K491DRAFT_695615 [Lophiostoma macrostomum CBS 122681]
MATPTSSKTTNTPTLLNAANSPLLTLPAELRIIIYKLLLGDRLIHVNVWVKHTHLRGYDALVTQLCAGEISLDDCRDSFDSPEYLICQADCAEDMAYDRFRTVSLNEQLPAPEEEVNNSFRAGDPFYVDSCQKRHALCLNDFYAHPDPLSSRLNLKFLQTCSQIYQEAKALPFETNMFGFQTPWAIIGYLSWLTSIQRQSLSALWMYRSNSGRHYARIIRPTGFGPSFSWAHAILGSAFHGELQGLHTVHVSLDVFKSTIERWQRSRRRNHTKDYEEDEQWSLGLKACQKLSLQKATVIVSDNGLDGFGVTEDSLDEFRASRAKMCLTVEEKRQLADELEGYMLGSTTQDGT